MPREPVQRADARDVNYDGFTPIDPVLCACGGSTWGTALGVTRCLGCGGVAWHEDSGRLMMDDREWLQ